MLIHYLPLCDKFCVLKDIMLTFLQKDVAECVAHRKTFNASQMTKELLKCFTTDRNFKLSR